MAEGGRLDLGREPKPAPDQGVARSAELWAELSHDLRQPIQSLQLLTHVATGTDDAAVLARTLGYMTQGLAALQEMVETTGLLARLEAGRATPAHHRLPLSELLADAERVAGPINLVICGADTVVCGDRALLGLSLRGFLEMAACASVDGVVRVSGMRSKPGVQICCSYQGDALSGGWETAFFADLPPSGRERTRDWRPVAGFALIKRLAAAMGWTACIGSGPDGAHQFILAQSIRPGA